MTYPIVLAHGIARFDVLRHEFEQIEQEKGVGDEKEIDDRLHYFRRIRSTLRAEGFDAHHSDVSFAAAVKIRASELRRDIEAVLENTGASCVHVVAHSMGGLDARHMLFKGRDEGFHEKVASLTTIGTPHLGTSFADWGVSHAHELFQLLDWAGVDSLDGFQDLTREACRDFDARAEPFERSCGVEFRTLAGVQELPYVFGPLQFPWLLIQQEEGPNDGLVPLRSARWRSDYFERTLQADHLNEVGWWDLNELGLRFFPSVAEKLRSRREKEAEIRSVYVELAKDLARRFP